MAGHPRILRPLDILLVDIRAQRKDRDRGSVRMIQGTDSGRSFISVHDGHAQIHQDDIIRPGRRIFEKLDSLLPVADTVAADIHSRKDRPHHFRIHVAVFRDKNMHSGQAAVVPLFL